MCWRHYERAVKRCWHYWRHLCMILWWTGLQAMRQATPGHSTGAYRPGQGVTVEGCTVSVTWSGRSPRVCCLYEWLRWRLHGPGTSKAQEVRGVWPSDAIWRNRTAPTLVQVMTCCLMALSHYLNQCWLIMSKGTWYSLKGIISKTRFEIAFFLITSISPRDLWVYQFQWCHITS